MKKSQITIPPKDREEWVHMVTDQIDHQFQNFVLQLKSAAYRKKVASGQVSVEDAVDDMYQLCEKYALAVQEDFKQIFKDW